MTESGFRPTGTSDLNVSRDASAFAMLEPREQLATLLKEHVVGRPFSELASVTFDHRAATVMGHVLIDTLEDAGYSVDDFDSVGALTAAAVPMVSAMIHAAASRGEDLDGFVMDFVYPSIKGPSIEGRRVNNSALRSWLLPHWSAVELKTSMSSTPPLAKATYCHSFRSLTNPS